MQQILFVTEYLQTWQRAINFEIISNTFNETEFVRNIYFSKDMIMMTIIIILVIIYANNSNIICLQSQASIKM